VPEPIISVSGLRGVVGESLTPLVAANYTAAFAAGLPPGDVLISRDGRPSGRMITDAVKSALAAMGRRVIDADIAATPTTGILVRQHACAGGIQISASHNPLPYNGLKLFSAEGRVIPAAPGEEVLQRYRQGDIQWAPHDRLGKVRPCDDTTGEHLRLVLDTVDAERIRAAGYRVLLDSNHGAGSILGRKLLEALGCQVILLGEEPHGNFAHPAEPTAENLADVLAEVRSRSAHVGFCQDPDADRLAVIDENGRYIGEEYTAALCIDHVLRQTKGPVVTNCSSSRMAQDIAARHEVAFHHAKVGEANVVDKMNEVDAVFGGEGNGGPIDPRVGLVRDSFAGMALILDAMAARRTPVSALADELPRYAICKTKQPLDRGQIGPAMEKLEQHFADARPSRLDGLRLDWPDRWLLLRASNTEPIIRIIAEAKTEDAARGLCEEAAQVMK